MALTFITYAIVILSTVCILCMFYRLKQQPKLYLKPVIYLKLTVSGIIAFIADTIGVGSFAVNVALAKLFNTFPDEELPAVNNGAQVLPGTIESLFFMQLIDVDLTTLITLVLGTCIGGLIGGSIVSHLSKQAIRKAMIVCFIAIICLLLSHQMNLMPLGGNALELHSWKLILGFIAMIICGALTSVGIGLFVMVQSVLFLLNVSPLVAFPIMTTAGAMQQPLTTLVFLKENKIPLKKTLILSFAGCIGVLITLPFFTQLSTHFLYSLLLLILSYNLFAISRAFMRDKAKQKIQQTLLYSGN